MTDATYDNKDNWRPRSDSDKEDIPSGAMLDKAFADSEWHVFEQFDDFDGTFQDMPAFTGGDSDDCSDCGDSVGEGTCAVPERKSSNRILETDSLSKQDMLGSVVTQIHVYGLEQFDENGEPSKLYRYRTEIETCSS